MLTFSINPKELRDVDLFKLSQSLIVFSQLEVRAVKIHGDQGRAEVWITAPLSVIGGQANLSKRRETLTWPIRRETRRVERCRFRRTPFTCLRTLQPEYWLISLRFWQTLSQPTSARSHN
jgi:hypothetical protein